MLIKKIKKNKPKIRHGNSRVKIGVKGVMDWNLSPGVM